MSFNVSEQWGTMSFNVSEQLPTMSAYNLVHCRSMSFRGVDETQNWTKVEAKVEQNVDESWKWLQESHQITKS